MKIDEIYTIKLMSGEELLTKITGENEQYYVIKDPVSVAPGQRGLGLVPSMFTADLDSDVFLRKESIVLYSVPTEEIRVKYIEATTGIQVPEKKVILG
jgi:hypothetical protein